MRGALLAGSFQDGFRWFHEIRAGRLLAELQVACFIKRLHKVVKTAVMSFLLEGAHPHDVGMLLDQQGVAVRTGNHCAQPIMDQFGIPGTVRASFSIYNTFADVDRLFEALAKVRQFL